MSMTRKLVAVVRDKDVKQGDLDRAALFVHDTIGCALGAVQASFDAEARERLTGDGAKVQASVSPEIDAAYPRAWGAEVTVEAEDGPCTQAVRGISRRARATARCRARLSGSSERFGRCVHST